MLSALRASSARDESNKPTTSAAQNFKGGVGTPTVPTHLAHYQAVQGFWVLVSSTHD
jgi:chromosome partitioning protein